MARRRSWDKLKEQVWAMIEEDRLIGYLDPGIEGILDKLNRIPLIATTSSCIGRITIIEGVKPWDRKGSLIVYKTHARPRQGEVLKVLSRPFRNLWIKATGPILHIRTPSIQCSSWILEVFRPHGFKHSGIISLDQSRGYTVEIMSGVDVTAPIRLEGKDIIGEREAYMILDKMMDYIEDARRGLAAAVDRLEASPGPCGP